MADQITTASVRARFYTGTSNLGAFTSLRLSTRKAPAGPVLQVAATTPQIILELTPSHAVELIDHLADFLDAIDADVLAAAEHPDAA